MSDHPHPTPPTSRRSFLTIAAIGAGAVAVGAAGWGLLGSLSPSADVIADTNGFDIKLSDIPEGAEIRLQAYGLPILVRHRNSDQIAAAEQASPDQYRIDETLDVLGRRLGFADDHIRRATPDGRFIALVGKSQDFGCIPVEGTNGDFGGWFDPCGGNHYDTSGRIRKGLAPENLRLPVYELLDANTLRLITNPSYVRTTDLDTLLYR